jgi:hypothetical protein
VQIGGVKTTENPSDILTKFLPAPAHQEHSKYLNLTTPKPYTQNGNFIKTNGQPHLTSAIRPGQNIVHKEKLVLIRPPGQIVHFGQELLPPVSYQSKRQRQKQRQTFWTDIHTLRRQNPQLTIVPKQALTISRSPEFRHETKQTQSSTHLRAPRKIQHIEIPTTPTQKHPDNLRTIHANRQHPELQTRRHHNPLHQHPICRRIPDHDLHTPKFFTQKQQRRIEKWVNTMTHTTETQQDPNRRSHPFHPSHKDPSHASSSRKSRQYKRTIYRQTQRNRKQENRTKMTAKQNTYNFSHKRPKQTRSKYSNSYSSSL